MAILNTIKDPVKKRKLLNKSRERYLTPLDLVNYSSDLSDDERLRITKYLVDNGGIETTQMVALALAKREDSFYTKILATAARDGHIKTFQYFASQDRCNLTIPLNMAFKTNNFNIIQHIYDSHIENIELHESGNSALHFAISFGANLKIIKYLIDRGENVNAKNMLGQSPLFLAIFNRRRLNIIKYLIDHGADVNMEDITGKTPLSYVLETINSESEYQVDIATCQAEDIISYLLEYCNAKIPKIIQKSS